MKTTLNKVGKKFFTLKAGAKATWFVRSALPWIPLPEGSIAIGSTRTSEVRYVKSATTVYTVQSSGVQES